MSDPAAHEINQLGLGSSPSGFEPDEGDRDLSPVAVGTANDGCLEYGAAVDLASGLSTPVELSVNPV